MEQSSVGLIHPFFSSILFIYVTDMKHNYLDMTKIYDKKESPIAWAP